MLTNKDDLFSDLYRDYQILRSGGTLPQEADASRPTPSFRLKRPDFSRGAVSGF